MPALLVKAVDLADLIRACMDEDSGPQDSWQHEPLSAGDRFAVH